MNLQEDEKDLRLFSAQKAALPEGMCSYGRQLQHRHACSPADSTAAEPPATAGTGPGAFLGPRVKTASGTPLVQRTMARKITHRLSSLNLH